MFQNGDPLLIDDLSRPNHRQYGILTFQLLFQNRDAGSCVLKLDGYYDSIRDQYQCSGNHSNENAWPVAAI